jgi:hypothetical protein
MHLAPTARRAVVGFARHHLRQQGAVIWSSMPAVGAMR